jgi:hypothetical protein
MNYREKQLQAELEQVRGWLLSTLVEAIRYAVSVSGTYVLRDSYEFDAPKLQAKLAALGLSCTYSLREQGYVISGQN